MNVLQIKKKLLAGEAPEKEIRLRDTQIDTLNATVPSVKIHNSNATQFYFPEADTYLEVHYYGGGMRGWSEGRLFKCGSDYPTLKFEDGTRKYIIGEDGKPVVFNLRDLADRIQINITVATAQAALWQQKKPYFVKVDGYQSIHKRGYPRDERYGHRKTMLSIHDGDYETCYLCLEEISKRSDYDWKLTEAILNGEYDGSVSPDEFRDKKHEEAVAAKKAWERKYAFERFVRDDPVDGLNKIIDRHNEELDMLRKFFKIARLLKKKMKENPGWYRKIDRIKPGHGQKNSQLFKLLEELGGIWNKRRDHCNGGEGEPCLWWAAEGAVDKIIYKDSL